MEYIYSLLSQQTRGAQTPAQQVFVCFVLCVTCSVLFFFVCFLFGFSILVLLQLVFYLIYTNFFLISAVIATLLLLPSPVVFVFPISPSFCRLVSFILPPWAQYRNILPQRIGVLLKIIIMVDICGYCRSYFIIFSNNIPLWLVCYYWCKNFWGSSSCTCTGHHRYLYVAVQRTPFFYLKSFITISSQSHAHYLSLLHS